MHTLKLTLMTAAVALAAVSFAGNADAETHKKVPHTGDKTTITERVVSVTDVPVAGARRVGMVGGRPYPVIEGVVPMHSGGNYYTEETDVYYANPAIDVDVIYSGSFNN